MTKFTQLIRFGDNTRYHKKRVMDFISRLDITEKIEYKITIEKYKENKTSEIRPPIPCFSPGNRRYYK